MEHDEKDKPLRQLRGIQKPVLYGIIQISSSLANVRQSMASIKYVKACVTAKPMATHGRQAGFAEKDNSTKFIQEQP